MTADATPPPADGPVFSEKTVAEAVHHAAISEPATFDAMIRAALAAPGIRREVEALRARIATLEQERDAARETAGRNDWLYKGASRELHMFVGKYREADAARTRLAAALEAAERRITAALVAVPCVCSEAYTARGLVAPDCFHHDLAAALASDAQPHPEAPDGP